MADLKKKAEPTSRRARAVTNKLSINAYLHCGKCLKERPANQTPQEWSRIQVGWTREGLQVWCFRHNANVMNIDFEGMTHPANITCEAV